MKGSEVKTNLTVTVPPPNVKFSISLEVAITLTVLIRFLKEYGQQQLYVVLQQMYLISEDRNTQSRHRLKTFQKSVISNTFLMISRTNTMCGRLVRLSKKESMKIKHTKLHLFMR